MIHYKSEEELKIMRESGKMLSEVLWEVIGHVKPGISELELETLADKLIKEKGGEAGFRKVDGYKFATCISTNNVVVHGIPTDYELKEGDIIGVDCGVLYKGFNSDMAETVRVKSPEGKAGILQGNQRVESGNEDEIDKFLAIGKRALNEAIKVAVVGNRIGHISKKIQDIVEKEGGYSVVRSLIGHGVGRQLHEDPEVPGYLNRKIEKTPELLPGMTIAIEVIYNMGGPDVSFYNEDGWTIGSSDSSLSALFERSIAITKKGPEVLTLNEPGN
jgi:methionyl aminopeptidase